jgi:hypothetical protein
MPTVPAAAAEGNAAQTALVSSVLVRKKRRVRVMRVRRRKNMDQIGIARLDQHEPR